jgi:hypothetical protein
MKEKGMDKEKASELILQLWGLICEEPKLTDILLLAITQVIALVAVDLV